MRYSRENFLLHQDFLNNEQCLANKVSLANYICLMLYFQNSLLTIAQYKSQKKLQLLRRTYLILCSRYLIFTSYCQDQQRKQRNKFFHTFKSTENGLHIKFKPYKPIEKPFSKTHAPDFGLMLDRNFQLLNLGSRTNTVQ